MAEPFLGEIRMMGFNFPPKGWATCDGQLLPISQNTALYSLLGVTFGGDGVNTFMLPDLRGRTPVHPDVATVRQGMMGGQEQVKITTDELPMHNHSVNVNPGTGGTAIPASAHYAVTSETAPLYASGAPTQQMGMAIGSIGDGAPHNNLQPSIVMNFCIALQGLYPSRN